MASPLSAGPPGVRVLDHLRDEGRITAPQYETLYHQAKRSGERVEEMLLDSSAVTEAVLLKAMAAVHQTRFVGTERLAHAEIDPSTLARVPRKLAERFQCIPILHDPRTNTLSVVAYDLDADLAPQLSMVSQAREVRVIVARPAAVRAALRRFYAGDAAAFAGLLQPAGPVPGLDAFERPPIKAASESGSKASRVEPLAITFDDGDLPFGFAPPVAASPVPKPGPGSLARSVPVLEPIRIEMPRLDTALHFDRYLETVHVLVTLLEGSRVGLRGHSSTVGRLARQVGEALEVGEAERDTLVLVGYLHDLGKGQTLHLTALNVSRFDGHLAQAQRSYLAPVRQLESTRLSEATVLGLTHLHERFDGQGFPDRLQGRDIPISARMVSAVETYADLVDNPQNPYRRKLSPVEAFDVVQQLSGSLFDPVVVGALRPLVLGADVLKAAENATRVLLVDPDLGDTTLLELRLTEAGHGVRVVQGRSAAESALAEEHFDVVLSELDLGSPGAADEGFGLLQTLRRAPRTREMPFVFLSHRSDRGSVARGFELGASDFLVKPASPELVVAKVGQLLPGGTKRPRVGGFGGSLKDMGLPDVVQALSNGRKTGRLQIVSGGTVGEIHFLEGAVADASYGARAREDAIYAMLALKDGDFMLDPSFRPASRRMQGSIEALLLEGMRRMDEGLI